MKRNLSMFIFMVVVLAYCGVAFAQVSQVTARSEGYTLVANSAKFTFNGSVYTDKAGPIQYRWNRSDNANSTIRTLSASGPGWYQVEATTWSLGTKWSGQTFSITLEVLHPNNITSAPVSFSAP